MALAVRRKQTIYLATASGILINCSLVIVFNTFLFLMIKEIGSFDMLWFTVVITALHILITVTGFLYGVKQIKKEAGIRDYDWKASKASAISCALLGRGISRMISKIGNDQIESIIISLIFSGVCMGYMFFVGKTGIAIIYCIKKCNISNREIKAENE